MADSLGYQFERVFADAIEKFRQVATIAERDAIPTGIRYEGMLCYVTGEDKDFQLRTGVTNIDWAEAADGSYFDTVSDDSDDITEGVVNLFLTVGERNKLGFITITQAVDLDQLEIDVAALGGGVQFIDEWDASAGTFPGGGTASIGDMYVVTTAGTVDSVVFALGDSVIAMVNNASTTVFAANWIKTKAQNAVTSVVGLVGAVTKSGLLAALNVEDGATADQTGTEISSAITTFLTSSDWQTKLTAEEVEDFVGALINAGTQTKITVTYDDSGGKINFVVDPFMVVYATLAALIAAQGSQNTDQLYEVTDASGFTTVTSGRAWVRWNGGTAGTEADYIIVSKAETAAVVAPIPLTYADDTALFAGQGNQIDRYVYEVTDGSGFTGVSSGAIWVKYLGTTVGDETDYIIVSKAVTAGSGDMLAATYDPTSVSADSFAMDNMIEATVGKTTPVDADSISIWDSAASFIAKKLTWANVKAGLKTYFDTLYQDILSEGAFVDGDKTKLDGIEPLADVTDNTNVNAAGATMNADADVKANAWTIDEDTMVSDDDTKVPSQQSVKAYVDTTVASAKSYQGGYNAATNTPDLDTSPIAGIEAGDVYDVTADGTFFTILVEIGDTLTASQAAPTLESHWIVTQTNLTAASIKTSYESNADTNEFSDAEQTKLGAIEALADVTDAANVDSAGAVMETDYNAQTVLAATSDDTPVALTIPVQTLLGRITAGNIAALTVAQIRTLLNIEDGAAAAMPLGFAFGDETADIEVATDVLTFQMPNFATTLLDVSVNLKTAPTGSTAIFDLNEAGVSVLSTKISIDIGEKTSEDAATPPVISDSAIAANAIMTVDIDQKGSTISGVAPKIWIYFEKA